MVFGAAQRLHIGMRQQCIDRYLVALHHVENTFRQSGLLQYIGDQQTDRRIAFGRFQDEAIAAGQRHREVERRDAGYHSERLTQVPVVDTVADVLAVAGLQQMWNAAGELDHFDMPRTTSPLASGNTLPCSRVISAASLS